jgi:hypothetical protein
MSMSQNELSDLGEFGEAMIHRRPLSFSQSFAKLPLCLIPKRESLVKTSRAARCQ